MSLSIWAMRSIDAPSMSCRSDGHPAAVLRERLAEVLQHLVAGIGERDGGLEIVGRLIRADEPAADRERDFLLGLQRCVVGEALERGQPGDRIFVRFGRDFFDETLGQPAAIFVGDFRHLVVQLIQARFCGACRRPRTYPAVREPAATFRRRRLRRETARADCGRAGAGRRLREVGFLSGSASRRADAVVGRLARRSFRSGKSFMICFELDAGVAVALAGEVQPHELQAAFQVARLHGRGEDLAQHIARDAAGGDPHVPHDRPRAAAEAFDLGIERRDLRDALHDGERAFRAVAFRRFAGRIHRTA